MPNIFYNKEFDKYYTVSYLILLFFVFTYPYPSFFSFLLSPIYYGFTFGSIIVIGSALNATTLLSLFIFIVANLTVTVSLLNKTKWFFDLDGPGFYIFSFIIFILLFCLLRALKRVRQIVLKLSLDENPYDFRFMKSISGIALLALWLVVFRSFFKDGYFRFDSANEIAYRIYEDSKASTRYGAICKDGSESSSTGRGTCSHHGGVSEWLYDSEYHKTFNQCVIEAKVISWID